MPGGFADYNESGEEALKREIKEELNIDIEHFEYMHSFPNEYLFKEVQYYTLDQIYIARIDSTEGIQAADDISDYVWLKPSGINLDNIASPSIKKAILYYINKNIN